MEVFGPSSSFLNFDLGSKLVSNVYAVRLITLILKDFANFLHHRLFRPGQFYTVLSSL